MPKIIDPTGWLWRLRQQPSRPMPTPARPLTTGGKSRLPVERE